MPTNNATNGALILTPSSTQPLTAASAIAPKSGLIPISAASAIASFTSTPLIAAGVVGQQLELINVGATNIGLSDYTNSGTNLGLAITLLPQDTLQLAYLQQSGGGYSWQAVGGSAYVRAIASKLIATSNISTTITITSNYLSNFKNLIINGDFYSAQRGTSFTVAGVDNTASPGPGGNGAAILDRYFYSANSTAYASTSGVTISQQAFPAGQTDVPGNPQYFLRVQNLANTNYYSGNAYNTSAYSQLLQLVENCTVFVGQTLTVSFYAKSSIPSKRIGVNCGGTGQSFVLSSSWQLYTATYTPTVVTPSDYSRGVTIYFVAQDPASFTACGYGSAFGWGGVGTTDIANLQLELGSSATTFEITDRSSALLRCYRYTWQASNIALGAAYNAASLYTSGKVSFPVPMAKTPTLSNGTFSASSGSSGTPVIVSSNSFNVNLNNSANNWTSGAQIAFSGLFSADWFN